MSIFSRAAAGLSLSPAARALLRLIDGLIVAALVTALPVIAQLLANRLDAGAVDWRQMATLALASLAFAFLMALAKYAKAQGDAPLADVATHVADSVAAVGGLSSEVKSELSPDGQPNTPDSGPLGNPIVPGS